MKKILIILGVVLVSFLAVYLLGLYPALRINDEWVSRARISDQAEILRKIQETTGASETETDFELISLQGILKDSLISGQLIKEFDKKTLGSLIRDEVRVLNMDDLQKFSKLLGLSEKESLDFWLMPSIRENLLENKLVLKGEDLSRWLEEAKKSADVTLFFGKFRWDGTSFKRN